MSTAEPTNGATLRFRVDRVEQEQTVQRERLHGVISDQTAMRLLIQHTSDELDHLADDVRALKRAFYTFAFSVVGSSILFAFTVFALLGRHA